MVITQKVMHSSRPLDHKSVIEFIQNSYKAKMGVREVKVELTTYPRPGINGEDVATVCQPKSKSEGMRIPHFHLLATISYDENNVSKADVIMDISEPVKKKKAVRKAVKAPVRKKVVTKKKS